MSPELRALIVGVAIVAIPAFATWFSARRRPQVDSAEATDTITAAAERVVKNVMSDNEHLRRELEGLRRELGEFRDQLRTARSEVSSLRRDLAQERVDHEETREQVASLTVQLNRLTAMDTPAFGSKAIDSEEP